MLANTTSTGDASRSGLLLPCRAFYEAGMAWKAAGQLNMAFVLLNRYLDLADAVEEGAQMLENADFADTDVPFDAQLPDRSYVGESQREEVSPRTLSTCEVVQQLHRMPA